MDIYVNDIRLIIINLGYLGLSMNSCKGLQDTLITCSDCGPMPEVLENSGVYINLVDPDSISQLLKIIILDSDLRGKIARRAKQFSK